jgi:2-desacetyl-2-hydroxyethyl bacteriochlorophyllide A dehydrogenase
MIANSALVVINPGQIVLEDREAPIPGAGEVLVEPLRAGICGTDYHIFEGNQPFLSYPRVMGHELAVKVLEAPPDSGIEIGETYVVNPYVACGTCRACRKGKPNCCTRIAVLGVHRDGGMTKRLTLPAGNLVPSEGLSADECAMVEFLAIGAHAVRRATVSGEDEVLVVGAGPIGLGVARFAALAGATVTLIDRDQSRLDMAQKLIPGCKAVLAGQKDATFAEAFDVVFDATGNRASIETGFGFVAHGGRYCLVSVVKGDITFVDADFHRKEMTLMGSRNALAPDFKQVIGAIKAGHISSRDWITHRTTLAGAVGDLPLWAKDRSQLVKAIIEI